MRFVPTFLALALCSSVAVVANAEPESQKQPENPSVVVTVEANEKGLQIVAKPNQSAQPRKAAANAQVDQEEEEWFDDEEPDSEEEEIEEAAAPAETQDYEVERAPSKKASKKKKRKVRVLRRRNVVHIDDEDIAEPQKRHIWRGMTIAGGIVSGVGALFLGIGGGIYASDPVDDGWFDGIGRAYGAIFMTMGGIVSAVGLPMLIVGVTNPGNKGRPPAVTFSVTGTGVQLSGTF